MAELSERIAAAAEDALAGSGVATFTEVLVGIGWLAPVHVDRWKQGRIPYLEDLVQVRPDRIRQAADLFESWARGRGLDPSDTVPLARARHRTELRFGPSADPVLERAVRTSWISPELAGRARERVVARQTKAPDLVVIDPLGDDWTCHECGGTGDLLMMEGPGPICLACADLDHLVFLPAGEATLTRRAKKASSLSAVVVRFSRARKRYERQGILVEPEALDAAEQSCLADEHVRARRRERDAEHRGHADEEFVEQLRTQIHRLFPGCPEGRAKAIAAWTGVRGSGRVGRSTAGRALEPHAVERAVIASVRHQDTGYDALLMHGVARADARARVRADVEAVLEKWRLQA
ncbi:MAG TPA: DUF2293 domain-containing protein [Kineosporiaceae bacterium]|nr:DUF2293 domain-containing protein [Kineosporiaceae bacterium]